MQVKIENEAKEKKNSNFLWESLILEKNKHR